jgi:hypothetical protein
MFSRQATSLFVSLRSRFSLYSSSCEKSGISSIDDLIRQSANPFDRLNIRLGNFWSSANETAATVDTIHQPVFKDLTQRLAQISKDHKSRSVLLTGDSGVGKSHLLSRLRQALNDKAFFAYIGPWVDSQYIWRHILRYTIDSLMQIPEGRTESQLILWLKGLSAFTKRSLKQRVFNDSVWGLLHSDRRKFINHLKTNYKDAGIHSPDIFFSVLRDLTDPDRYDLACEWLRGDDLSEDSLQLLRVKRCVDSEDDAKNILANISKIAADTLPIVLCFDNLDNIPHLEAGGQDFQALFNVNTILHNDGLKNFLVIISIIKDTWQHNRDKINPADISRIDDTLSLRQISLDQAEALWESQLLALHQNSSYQFPTPIAPLTRQLLEDAYPAGKTLPRNAIILGREKYQNYKMGLLDPQKTKKSKPPKPKAKGEQPVNIPAENGAPLSERQAAEFQLKWQQEHSRVQEKITKITSRSSPELVKMLLEALTALDVDHARLKALSGKYASYSLQYLDAKKDNQVVLVWSEDASMQSFSYLIKACEKAIENATSQIYLIRAGDVGNSKLVSHKLYRQIFINSQHQHIKPSLAATQMLATYHSLVNATLAGEFVLAGQVIVLKSLQALVQQTGVLKNCQILQDLGVVEKNSPLPPQTPPIQDYILQTLTTQHFMGLETLITSTIQQFDQVSQSDIKAMIQQLCEQKCLQIMNPEASPTAQLICWVPK